jgi:hypothetical protein
MANLWIDSCDHYRTAQIAAKYTTLANSVSILVGGGRCGTNCLRFTAQADLIKGLAFAASTGYTGFAFMLESVGSSPSTNVRLFSFDSPTGKQVYYRRWPDGSIRAYNDDTDLEIGTSAPGVVQQDVWYYFEPMVTVHPSAGVIAARLNGATLFSNAGVNTRGQSDNTLSAIHWENPNNHNFRIDDIYANDDVGAAPNNSFWGDTHVERLRPAAAGALQQFSLVGAASHWQAVDDGDSPDGDTSYIWGVAAGLIDTELFMGTGLPAGTIYSMMISPYARKTDSGVRTLRSIIRRSGSNFGGPSRSPSAASYAYLPDIRALDPSTGVAWTIAGVNAAEYGAEILT